MIRALGVELVPSLQVEAIANTILQWNRLRVVK
jgi:hypothetical protein